MPSSDRRVLILGAGTAGAALARELASDSPADRLVGFLDDDPATHGRFVEGVLVLGPVSDLATVAAREAVTEALIAIPSAPGHRIRAIAALCRQAGLACRTMPGIIELLGRELASTHLRPVVLADLLRRMPVGCDEPPEAYLAGARVLVTGAGGSIGAELCRQIARARPEQLILLGHGENSIFEIACELRDAGAAGVTEVIADIRDEAAIERVFTHQRPTVVFHAAAHKHVPLMEGQPLEAARNNVFGTRVVLDAATRHETERFVLISTDKAVRPSSVMGSTKRLAERLVRHRGRATGRTMCVVRFGNVLGSRGSVLPRMERQILAGGPVTVTHPEVTRYFMTIPEAVFLVLRALGHGYAGGLYVLDMGAPVRLVDLAADLMRLVGRADAVPIVFTGLRPGEKLHERLWEFGAHVTRLADGLLKVEEPGSEEPDQEVEEQIERLAALVARGDEAAVRSCLRETSAREAVVVTQQAEESL
jgi:FlaA1/EpsC-like NDP-sugar epimerase